MSFPNKPNPMMGDLPDRLTLEDLRRLRPDQMSLSQRLELERNQPNRPPALRGIPSQAVSQSRRAPIFRGVPSQTIPTQLISRERAPVFRQIPSINPEENQHLYQILDRAGISMDDIHNKPWTGEGKNYFADPGGKSFQDKEMLDFLNFTKKNPTASSKDIKDKFNCVGQNCSTNTVFGLSKMRARTKEGNSPRSEILNHSNNQGIDLDEALGMNEKYRDKEGEDTIPKGTVAFLKNPEDEQGMPFDHVFFAEEEGKDTGNIYRSLNAGQNRSELQSLGNVLKQGGYNIPPYEKILSGKYRYFFK